jgi:hypothetical protein
MSVLLFVKRFANSKTASLLKNLHILGNSAGRVCYMEIIDILSHCHNLQVLKYEPALSHGPPMLLTGCELIHTIPTLKNLRRLDVPLYCVICADLSQLSHLRSMKLSDFDLFAGPIENLPSLERLHLVFCQDYLTRSAPLIDWSSLPRLAGGFIQISGQSFRGEPTIPHTLSFRGKVRPMRPYPTFFSPLSATLEKLRIDSRLPSGHCRLCFKRLQVLACRDYVNHPFRGAVFPRLSSLDIQSDSVFIRPIFDFQSEILQTVVMLTVRQGHFGSTFQPPLQRCDLRILTEARCLRHLVVTGYQKQDIAIRTLQKLPLETLEFNENVFRPTIYNNSKSIDSRDRL